MGKFTGPKDWGHGSSHGKREGREPKCLDYIRKSLWGKGSSTAELESSGLGRVCQVATEGCWEILGARSALLLSKICTSVPCPRV